MGLGEWIIIALLGGLLVMLTLVMRRLNQRPTPPAESVPAAGGASPVVTSAADNRAVDHDSVAQQREQLTERVAAVEARERRVAQERAEVAQERAEHTEERDSLRQWRQQLDARETRLASREERLDTDQASLAAERSALSDREAELAAREAAITEHEARVAAELERISHLSPDQARSEMLARVEHEARLQASALARRIEQDAHDTADARARDIITTAIQRLAAPQTADSVLTVVELPHEHLKGRVIGREGRNIRTFEQVTGVNLLIDDTPGVVVLSSFDPIRREAARLTLEELIDDGRIHPARIEEEHARSLERVDQLCLDAADDALAEMGITDLDPALRPVVGSLRFRTSYGQNVLAHLVECGHLAAMMAAELGLDPRLAKRAAFLHDVGKALTPEVEGSHALIGADLARTHGECDEVVHAIEAHHNEVEPRTVEAWLVQAADAISGSRPAARREPVEAYVQRLESLERIASQHDGVDRVFAMHAGREVRVMVLPEVVDDDQAQILAREIARDFESDVTFPGEIKVTVIRESRSTATAH